MHVGENVQSAGLGGYSKTKKFTRTESDKRNSQRGKTKSHLYYRK